MNDELDDHVVAGDDAPPDVTLNPVDPDDDPRDVFHDPEMGDMHNVPAESFEADESDTRGADDKPGDGDGS